MSVVADRAARRDALEGGRLDDAVAQGQRPEGGRGEDGRDGARRGGRGRHGTYLCRRARVAAHLASGAPGRALRRPPSDGLARRAADAAVPGGLLRRSAADRGRPDGGADCGWSARPAGHRRHRRRPRSAWRCGTRWPVSALSRAAAPVRPARSGRTATARRLAARATTLLTAEATPECSAGAAPMAVDGQRGDGDGQAEGEDEDGREDLGPVAAGVGGPGQEGEPGGRR